MENNMKIHTSYQCCRWVIDSEISCYDNFPLEPGMYAVKIEQMCVENVRDRVGFTHVSLSPSDGVVSATYLPELPRQIGSIKTIYLRATNHFFDFTTDDAEPSMVAFCRGERIGFRLIDNAGRVLSCNFSLIISCKLVKKPDDKSRGGGKVKGEN